MDKSVILNLEYEAAEELIKALQRVINYDNDNDFLCTDDHNALDELKDTLIFKVGEY